MLPVIIMFGVIISLMFGTTWKLLGILFFWAIHIAKWVFIVAIVWAFLNCDQAYKKFGFTPLSLMVGDEIYKK